MKKIFLLGMATLFFTGMSFGQTGTQTSKDHKGKVKDSTHTATMKPCPGKTCGKKKS